MVREKEQSCQPNRSRQCIHGGTFGEGGMGGERKNSEVDWRSWCRGCHWEGIHKVFGLLPHLLADLPWEKRNDEKFISAFHLTIVHHSEAPSRGDKTDHAKELPQHFFVGLWLFINSPEKYLKKLNSVCHCALHLISWGNCIHHLQLTGTTFLWAD